MNACQSASTSPRYFCQLFRSLKQTNARISFDRGADAVLEDRLPCPEVCPAGHPEENPPSDAMTAEWARSLANEAVHMVALQRRRLQSDRELGESSHHDSTLDSAMTWVVPPRSILDRPTHRSGCALPEVHERADELSSGLQSLPSPGLRRSGADWRRSTLPVRKAVGDRRTAGAPRTVMPMNPMPAVPRSQNPP